MRDDGRARSFFERQGRTPVAGHTVDRGDGSWELRYRRQLSGRHPGHDDVAREVRGWFTAPVPEIGLDFERHEYGFRTRPGSPVGPRLVLTVDDPARVGSALSMAGFRHGTGDFEIWVDDRGRAARVHDALVASGWRPVEDTTFLALVGPIAAHPGPSELTVEEVAGEAALLTWSATKLQAFADSEAPPAPAALAAEAARRWAEAPVARYELARLDGAPVAVLACYTGSDQLVFNLATRVPHRHRGIGQALLGRWASRGVDDGCRSLMINAKDGGPAAALYRRMGFVDEVYWFRRYRSAAPTSVTVAGGG